MAVHEEDNVIDISEVLSENREYEFQEELHIWLAEKIESEQINVMSVIGCLEVAKAALTYGCLEDVYEEE